MGHGLQIYLIREIKLVDKLKEMKCQEGVRQCLAGSANVSYVLEPFLCDVSPFLRVFGLMLNIFKSDTMHNTL